MEQETLFKEVTKGAIFGEERTKRYILFRIWDDTKPKAMFIGLNPSTADDKNDDPTIRRVMSIANYNGFGGIYMVNLFSFVTPYPSQLPKGYCIDTMNKSIIDQYSKECTIVFVWGNFKETAVMGKKMIEKFPEAMCLVKNKNGSPKHPLYCRTETKLIKFA